jgi:signal transduction histidine kinase
MMRVAQNLIDAQEIRDGGLSLRREPTAFADIVEEAIHAVRSAAALKGVSLDRDVSPSMPKLPLDSVQMDRVVWNLLDNAIRCAPAGGEVFVSLERDGAVVRLGVSDDGNGIDRESIPSLFEPHTRPTPHGFRSPGLGLYIVKKIVEAHGGTIDVESERGGGTTFVVTLPVPEAPAVAERVNGHDPSLVLQTF